MSLKVANRALRSARIAQAIGVAALVLLGAISIGYGVWIGLSDKNIKNAIRNEMVSTAGSLTTLQQQLSMIQGDLLEVLDNNMTGVDVQEFTMQSGTVRWSFGNSDFDSSTAFEAEFPPLEFYDSVTNAPYELRSRQFNGVNFTYLFLSPPARSLTMTQPLQIPKGAVDFLGVRIFDFDPPITKLNQVSSTPFSVPLTASNFAKFAITPDCTMEFSSPAQNPEDANCFQVSRENAAIGLQKGLKFSFINSESPTTVISYGYQGSNENEYQWDDAGAFGSGPAAEVTITDSLVIPLPLTFQ